MDEVDPPGVQEMDEVSARSSDTGSGDEAPAGEAEVFASE